MKKLFSNVSHKLLGVFPALAFFLAVSSVSSTCFYLAHQPDVPNELKQFEV